MSGANALTRQSRITPTRDSPRRLRHALTKQKQPSLTFSVLHNVASIYHSTMGKGGDASAAFRGPMKLVGDKSEKITWSEVKKHVSFEAFLV